MGEGYTARGGAGYSADRRRRTEEGKPTGITREDVHERGEVQFEGQRAQLFYADTDAVGDVEHVVLRLDAGGMRLTLYGHFRGNEFMEVDREPLD